MRGIHAYNALPFSFLQHVHAYIDYFLYTALVSMFMSNASIIFLRLLVSAREFVRTDGWRGYSQYSV